MYSSTAIAQSSLFPPPFTSPDHIHQEDDERAYPSPSSSSSSFTRYQSPTRAGAKSLVNALIRLLEAGSPSSYGSRRREPESLDILYHLPPEISVMILNYLHPKDLCNASLVSRRWYQLTQCEALNKKRLSYLQLKREEYLRSKLRYPLSPHDMNPHVSFSSLATSPPPTADSPSSPIHTPQRYHSHPTSPTSWESPQRSHTSSPTFLVEDVRRLSLDDCSEDSIIHHHHFHPHQRSLSAMAVDQESRSLQNTLYTLRHTMKEVAGRKANKNRLRRLSLLS